MTASPADTAPRTARRTEEPARRDRSVTPRWLVPATFAGLLLVSFSRSPYLFIHGRFWAEEGAVHFQHMFEHEGAGGLLFVYGRSGYFDGFANAATWLAAQVSLIRAPLVTVWISFGVIVAMLWIILYWPSALLPTRDSRIIAAVLMVVGTVAIPEVWLNSLEAQTYLTLMTVLLLFVHVTLLTRVRFVFGAAVIATAALSGVYTGLLAPLFIVRAVMQRSRRAIVYATVVTVATAIQLAVVVHLHGSGETGDTKLVFRGVGTIAKNVSSYHVAGFLFGPLNASRARAHAGSPLTFAGLSVFALVVLVILAAMLVRVPDRRVPLALAAAFLIEELGINYGAGSDVFQRFAVVPIGILILMLVHGTAATDSAGLRAAGLGLCALVFVFGLSTFWTYQEKNLRCQGCPDWAHEVEQWHQGQTNRLGIWPYPRWVIHLSPPHPQSALPRIRLRVVPIGRSPGVRAQCRSNWLADARRRAAGSVPRFAPSR